MRDVRVQPAEARHLEGVQRVAQTTWRATYRGTILDADIERFLERNYSIAALEQILERPLISLHVALDGEELVGYATAGVNRYGEAELFAIYVLPDYQGRGVGRLLWQAARAFLAATGRDDFILWVLDSNETARRFYERQGARFAGERDFPMGTAAIREVLYRTPIT